MDVQQHMGPPGGLRLAEMDEMFMESLKHKR